MKSSLEPVCDNENCPLLEFPRNSGIFIDLDMNAISEFLNEEYQKYISQNGNMDRFSFMKIRIKALKTHGEIHTAEQYGFAYLAWYEQELIKVYKKMMLHKRLSLDNNKHLVFIILTKIIVREIEWSMIIEQQEIMKKFFDYWKDQFKKLLESHQKTEPQSPSVVSD